MSYTIVNNDIVTADQFEQLMMKLGRSITKKQLIQIKRSLHGHIDSETIKKMRNGETLLFYLRFHKLLSASKLAFFTKLVQEIDGGRIPLSLLDDYKIRINANKIEKETLHENSDEEVKTLQIIEDRQVISLKESENVLEKLDVSRKELEGSQNNLYVELKGTCKKQERLKEKKARRLSKYHDALNVLKKKEDEIKAEEKVLESLEEECESLRNRSNELKVNQSLKGESRLNAFQKTLERDQIASLARAIHDIRRNILDYKQKLMCLNEDSDEILKNLDLRREKLRQLVYDKFHTNVEQSTIYKKLESVQCRTMEIIDQISNYTLAMTETELALEETRKMIEAVSNAPTVSSISTTVSSIEELLQKSKKVIDYATLGTKIYYLGQSIAVNRQVQLDGPMSVKVDRNGDILVIDYHTRSKCYRIVNFTISGEINYEIFLDTLKPIGMAIDLHNHYIVAGNFLVRIYRRTDLIKQFVPYYIPRQMEFPKIVSIEFNKHEEVIMVLDGENKVIQAFTLEGEIQYVTQIPNNISVPNKFHVLSRNSLIITDSAKHAVNICKFESQNIMSCVSKGVYGIGQEEFVQPSGVFSDISANVLICDTGNHRICALDSNGDFKMSFGRFGTGRNSFKHPVDITTHLKHGSFIIADRDNNRVAVYLS